MGTRRRQATNDTFQRTGAAIVQPAVMRWASRCLTTGLLGLVVGLGAAGAAGAAGLPSMSFGASVPVRSVNGQLTPTDLSAGSAAGMGVARIGVFDGVTAYSDAVVTLLAQAHVRLYPILGVPCPSGESSCSDEASSAPAVAASQIAQIVTAFAQRYGSGGTFWKANPQLTTPEPIESYEIGNEPNLRLYWVVDSTHLHWADPSNPNAVDAADYAQVYEAARSALHAVDPAARAVIGGLADSASDGVDVEHDEQFLSAFAPGSVDAVGFHPWVFDVSDSLLEPNTSALRVWMNGHGYSGVPLDINEIGACQSNPKAVDANRCPASESQTSAQWGQVATSYMQWALCTPWVGVENVQAFYWGDEPQTASEVYLPLLDSSGAVTPYGIDYLNLVGQLSTTGCPGNTSGGTAPTNTAQPSVTGTPVTGSTLTADPGTWSGGPNISFSYQWESCDVNGANCAAIAGANSTTYSPQAGDVGSTLVFSVTATDQAGAAAVSSSPTGVVTVPQAQQSGTTGTPPGSSSAKPSVPLNQAKLRSMGVRVLRVTRHGLTIVVTVRHLAHSGTLSTVAATRGRRAHHRRLRGRRVSATTMRFTMRLSPGRWTLTISGTPAKGFAVPKPVRRRVVIKR